MQPLNIKAKCVMDAPARLEQIKYALQLVEDKKIQEFGPTRPHDKQLVVVGSGPSVKHKRNLKKIRNLKKKGAMILAIKGAHDFLIKNKIIPHAALAVDPLDHIWKCFRKKLPVGALQRPAYLIASQCHKTTFDYLEDQQVILWHLLATSSGELLSGRLQVGGGSTSGSRGIVLGYMMGFRDFHLFGFDSCLEGDGTSKLRKVTGERWGRTDVKEGEKEEPILELVCEGKTFYADPAMAAQANEIQDVVAMLEGSRFKAYGHGLIQTVFETNAKKEMGGYYAVSDEFGEGRIPKVHEGDVALVKQKLAAAREGVYRGRDYYGSRGGEVAA
jgi:uncharacterized Rossmann fold enzyme